MVEMDNEKQPEQKNASIAGRLRDGALGIFRKLGRGEDVQVEHDAQIARFKRFYLEFRKLLSANNEFLENIADLEDKLLQRQYIDFALLKRRVLNAVVDVNLMINSINVIAQNRYAGLHAVFEKIAGELGAVIDNPQTGAPSELVLDMAAITGRQTQAAGGKMANLATVRNILHLPTPDGFVVTTQGSDMILTESGVRPLLQAGLLEDISDSGDITSISASLTERIFKVNFPPALEQAILSAHDRLVERAGAAPRLAVRSSALREDSSLSFAGQFSTELNVPRESLIDAYLKVLASLFSPEAIQYRLLHGIGSESTAMAVGFIEMIDSAASGVMFSNDPNNPEPGQTLIHGVRGLGVTLVDGMTSPEEIVLTRERPARVLERTASDQSVSLTSGPDAGLVESEIDGAQAAGRILTDAEAGQLAEWALALESHFGNPQDIEWTLDGSRRLVLLQSRPLRIAEESGAAQADTAGMPVLLTGGEAACRGIDSGVAVHLDEDDDLDAFPDGGVLVARRSSPKFVRVMKKARAIITDAGSTTGHMASLSREFQIPTILNMKTATQAIPAGAPITVDASEKTVYSGLLPEAAREKPRAAATESAAATVAQPDEITSILKKSEELLVPLHLINPKSSNFNIEGCRTLHDMARFIHEMSYKEMFSLGLRLDDYRSSSYHLGSFLQTDLYIIDLGEGIDPPAKGRKVRLGNVLCIPLSAFLGGLLNPEMLACSKPIDTGGFLSLMARHTFNNPETEDTFGYPSYAIVTRNYLNFTARMGYHFSVVDTYCGDTPNNNYINIMFRGGAADKVRRMRRAMVIKNILKAKGLSATVSHDTVNARLSKGPREEIEKHLDTIGRLLQFVRQMDVSMKTDAIAGQIQQAFLEGDYCLSKFHGG